MEHGDNYERNEHFLNKIDTYYIILERVIKGI